jgi:hypothetical protein
MGMNGLVGSVLQGIGINPERFSLQWASAAEAPRFVKLITGFTNRIKELGPLGQAEGIEPDEVKTRLAKALEAVSSRKVRMVFGNTTKTIRKEGIFTQEYISSVIEEKLTKAVTGALAAEPAKEEKAPVSEKKTAAKKAAPKKKAAAKKTAPKKPAAKKAAPKKKAAAKKAAPKKTAAKAKPTAKKAAPKKTAKKADPAAKKAAPKKAAKKKAAPKKKK